MNKEDIPIIIDGPNYINRILDMSIDKDIISNQLSFNNFRDALKIQLNGKGVNAQLQKIEFVCSKKLFGEKLKKFTQIERDVMLDRIMFERGVHIEEIDLPGSQEKGVDNMITTKIESFSEKYKQIILITNDRDFVPLLSKMRKKETNIILVSLSKTVPKELINESYIVINLYNQYECLFNYNYPHYPLYRDFDLKKYREIVSNADDRVNNQFRVTTTGFVYLSYKDTGFKNILGLQFRYETYGAGNGYVGPVAASDSKYIEKGYKELIMAWKRKDSIPSYLDGYPIWL